MGCVVFLALQVFDRIRSADDAGKAFEKVVCINGDVSDPDLGLSAEDRQRLCSDVTIVFHSAATVKFNETLRTAVTLNTLGTRRVVDLCRSMPKLKVRTQQRTLELIFFFIGRLRINDENLLKTNRKRCLLYGISRHEFKNLESGKNRL